jgi:WD40 repeat protein
MIVRAAVVVLLLFSLAGPVRAETPLGAKRGTPLVAEAGHGDRYGDPLPEGAIARLGTVRFRTGTEWIHSLRFSPDGRALVLIDPSCQGRIWQAATGKEEARFRVQGAGDWSLTPDGGLLAERIDRQSIRISETATGRSVRERTIPDHSIGAFCLSPDGKTLVASVTDHPTAHRCFLRVWTLADGEKRWDLPVARPKADKTFSVDALSFADEGKILIARLTREKKAVLERWNYVTGEELPTRITLPENEALFRLSPDGTLLAVARKDGRKSNTLRLLEVSSGESRRELAPAIKGDVLGIRFSPDGRIILAATSEEREEVHLWRVADGSRLPSPLLDGVYPKDVIFSPDGRRYAIQERHSIHLFDTTTGKRLHELPTTTYYFDLAEQTGYSRRELAATSSVAFSPDGKVLATGTPGRVVRLWEVATGKEVVPAPGGHQHRVESIAFSPDGKTVASAGDDDSARLWEAASGRELRVLSLAPGEEVLRWIRDVGRYRVAFSPDGEAVATVGSDNLIQRWSVRTGASQWKYLALNGGIRTILCTPDGKRVLAGGNGKVLAFDARSGKAIQPPPKAELAKMEPASDSDTELALAVSPDGRLIATAGWLELTWGKAPRKIPELHVWEQATGKLRRRLPDEENERRILYWITASPAPWAWGPEAYRELLVAFAPDGKTLAWNQGEAVELIDVARGVSLRRFTPRPHRVAAIAFSPAGGMLAIACRDGVVQLVDPETGSIVGGIEGEAKGLECIAFSPDGRTLATGGADTTILLWDVKRLREMWRRGPRPVPAATLEKLWQSLASEKGTEAADAIAQLQAAPRQAVALLRERLRPAPPVDPRRVGQLMDDLASEVFAVRQRATRDLEQLGDLAEPLLRKRQTERPSLEMHRRFEAILDGLESLPLRPEQMRADRALEVLEQIGSAEARALLRELAGGAAESRLTKGAKASMERLARRPPAR